ncbi:hypothetical protein HBB16_14440 [Pseudonocardia sp. MCCB 268]|nr:hypothetical protein [Pseudonocardia cytotoxica]
MPAARRQCRDSRTCVDRARWLGFRWVPARPRGSSPGRGPHGPAAARCPGRSARRSGALPRRPGDRRRRHRAGLLGPRRAAPARA